MQITPENLTVLLGIIAVLTIVWQIYFFFRNPQIKMDKQLTLTREEEKSKAELLAQQLQWEKEANVQKFLDMGVRLDKAFEIAQNHIHSIEIKVDSLTNSVNSTNLAVQTLTTIIDERLPKIK